MKLKRNISFALNTRKQKQQGEGKDKLKTEHLPIRMRVTYKGERVDTLVGYSIDVNKWNITEQRVLNKATNKLGQTATEINTAINDYAQKVESIFMRYELDNIEPTFNEVKDAIKSLFDRSKSSDGSIGIKNYTLLDRFDEFVAEMGRSNNWTDATFEKFRSVRNHISDFNPHLGVDDFDNDTLSNYLYFLQDKLEMRNTTIKKQLGFLKWYLRWAEAKGYSTQRACFSFTYKPKVKDNKKIIFLDWDELMHLNSFDIPESKKYLERVRDVFCFCCFTSLRYSDVYNLRRSDIKKDTIQITTIKTSDSLTIDLNKYSRAILDKYKDIPFNDNKALPVISNQRMNDYLKELGKLVGFDELIREVYFVGNERKEIVLPKYELLGTHAGRRTFICNALMMGIPAQVVMKWTGHSDYKAMKPYIDVAEKTRKKAMTLFDKM